LFSFLRAFAIIAYIIRRHTLNFNISPWEALYRVFNCFIIKGEKDYARFIMGVILSIKYLREEGVCCIVMLPFLILASTVYQKTNLSNYTYILVTGMGKNKSESYLKTRLSERV
jgi:hypothetical protein